MKRAWRFFTAGMFCLAFSMVLLADDGMWMPHQMKDLDLQKLGLQMDPGELYKTDGTGLMSAVVSFGGGTGEFVSKEGLLLTNHHVAFGAIQRASTKEENYIEKGFLASTLEEEIPALGYYADVLLGYEEVTSQVTKGLTPKMSPLQRAGLLEKNIKALVAKAEKGESDLRANVSTMYSGNRYYLFRYKRIKDIRLVFAPSQDIGNFGGEVDNWMWPRHTGDFSYMRAYVSKDNKGVEYSKENVPYKPKAVLKISLEGVKERDFQFVMGYPGRTYRTYSLAAFKYDMENLKRRRDTLADQVAFFEEVGKKDKVVEIKYAGRVKGLNNGLKNYTAKLEGFEKFGILEKKAALEKELTDWINADPSRVKRYGNVVAQIESFLQGMKEKALRNESLGKVAGGASTVVGQAYTIYRAVQERQKPDLKREEEFQERNLASLKMRMEMVERGYVPEVDKSFLKRELKKMMKLPAEQMPLAVKPLLQKGSDDEVDRYVDDLYANTGIVDPAKRAKMLQMTPLQLKALKDPAIQLAQELETEMKKMRDAAKAENQRFGDLNKAYLAALLEMKNNRLAPDANSTIRFTYGTVEGYSPKDSVYLKPQTTLKGVLEKDRGVFPFRVPEKLKELAKSRDYGRYEDAVQKDITPCFLNSTNVTGGNSGSPTINAKGEQVGIIFDMTYESVIGDYLVIPELQRTVSVDIRYVLFVTDKVAGAQRLLKEMGLAE